MPLTAYDLVRCGVCGDEWKGHSEACVNHRHRPGETVPADSVPVLVGVDDEHGFNLILDGGSYIVRPKPGNDFEFDNPFVFKKT